MRERKRGRLRIQVIWYQKAPCENAERSGEAGACGQRRRNLQAFRLSPLTKDLVYSLRTNGYKNNKTKRKLAHQFLLHQLPDLEQELRPI
jgi:hypothetical protein